MADQIQCLQTRATANDADANPLPGALIYVYQTGTTTGVPTYTDNALTVPHAQPIVADAAGRFGPIFYGGSLALKIVIKTSAGTTVDTIDPAPRWSATTDTASDITFTPVASNPETDAQAAIEYISDEYAAFIASLATTPLPITAVRFGDGSAAAPSITFASNLNTGVYRVGANQLGFSCGGVLKMTMTTSALQMATGINMLADPGSAGAPGLSFSGDPNTGLFWVGADQIGVTAGGTVRVTYGTASVSLGAGVQELIDYGTAALPGLAFNGDPDTGIYRPSANQIGFATSGALRANFSDTALTFASGISISGDPGTAANPGYAFNGDGDTGMYWFSANKIGWATAGVRRATLDNADFSLSAGIQVLGDYGTVLLPGYSFNGDPDTGLYRSAANQISIATAGVARATLDANQLAIGAGVQTQADFGTVALPGFAFNGDIDTGFYRSGNNQIGAATGGSVRTTLDATGLALLGPPILADYGTAAAPGVAFNGDPNTGMYWFSDDKIGWATGGTRRMTLDSADLSLSAGIQVLGDYGTALLPGISFNGDPNTGFYRSSADNMGVASGGTEYFRFASTGTLRAGCLSSDNPIGAGSLEGAVISPTGFIQVSRNDNTALTLNRYTGDGTIAAFRRSEVQVGTISVTTTATAYNTSSDYRLKTVIDAPTDYDIAGRIAALDAALTWFEWNAAPDQGPQFGALAHVLQGVAPYAVTGAKDAVDDGQPQYQGVDWSKVVPELIAALADAHRRIAALEAAA